MTVWLMDQKKVVWMGVREILLNPFGSRGKYFKNPPPPTKKKKLKCDQIKH